jgi:alpha-L-fucosidase 2
MDSAYALPGRGNNRISNRMMKRITDTLLIAFCAALLTGCITKKESGDSEKLIRTPFTAGINKPVDWPAFLAGHDLVWDSLPAIFDHGAFLGNGMLGVMIYADGPDRIRFEIGRSDVTDHRRDNARLPIGGMILKTAGLIKSGTLRLVLWDAEVRGEVVTDKGRIRFRAMVHSDEMALIVDLEKADGEKEAFFNWEAEKAEVFRDKVINVHVEPNPPPLSGSEGKTEFCTQRRVAGGDFSTAWQIQGSGSKQRLILTVTDAFPGLNSKEAAFATIRRVTSIPVDSLEKTHRAWWHAYYPASFVSVPDKKIEGFYWVQMYKLACATRADRQVMDLLGPWYRSTEWPRVWWNLNIEIAYSPVYAANHPELGESFTRFVDAKRDNFRYNAKSIWGYDSCATVPHNTDYEGLRGDGGAATPSAINPGDFTWGMFLYWEQYRYTMDDALVTNQADHAFYPLLKESINLYLHLLRPGEDGKLHLPRMHSPEYSREGAADNNYNLALLRWGCTTLLYLNKRYGFNDSQRSEWQRVLHDLVPYPQDQNGFMIGATVPFSHSHRHWSHMLMVWPLHMLSVEEPANRVLLEKTLQHWLTIDKGREIYGLSNLAASLLYATMGNGEKALEHLRAHNNDKRFVMPNTMYVEIYPVIECSLFAARALQEMLLQSWGDRIRIFPAMPSEWREAVFNDLRAEGAFLVSAERRDGQTRWVRIKSLAGAVCRVRPGFNGAFTSSLPALKIQEIAPGFFELGLKKGEEVTLYRKDSVTQ